MTVRLVTVDLAAMTDALLGVERQTPRLSPSETARAERMAQGAGGMCAADRWRAAHVALRWVLEQQGVDELRAILRGGEFLTGKSGKPYLAGDAPSFSLSHGGGFAVMAVSTDGDVGIDVDGERGRALRMPVDRKHHLVRIAATLMTLPVGDSEAPTGARAHPVPLAEVVAADANMDTAALLAWVIIEAFAKAAGTGVGALLELCRGGVDERRLAAYGAWRGISWQVKRDVIAAAALPSVSGAPERLFLRQGAGKGRDGGLELVPVVMAQGEAVDGTVASGHKGRNGA